jgi:hypothetical protein
VSKSQWGFAQDIISQPRHGELAECIRLSDKIVKSNASLGTISSRIFSICFLWQRLRKEGGQYLQQTLPSSLAENMMTEERQHRLGGTQQPFQETESASSSVAISL